jgi:hypothetical protein
VRSEQQRRVRSVCGARVRRSSLRYDCPAVLGSVAHRGTRYVRCARCAQTPAMSQFTKRAARAATNPARPGQEARAFARHKQSSGLFVSGLSLGASHTRRSRSARAFAQTGCVLGGQIPVVERRAVAGGGAVWSGEQRRAGAGARSALRKHARRGCLSAVSAANVASSTAPPRTEQRSGVGAKRRPLHPAPPPATACRDAQTLERDG